MRQSKNGETDDSPVKRFTIISLFQSFVIAATKSAHARPKYIYKKIYKTREEKSTKHASDFLKFNGRNVEHTSSFIFLSACHLDLFKSSLAASSRCTFILAKSARSSRRIRDVCLSVCILKKMYVFRQAASDLVSLKNMHFFKHHEFFHPFPSGIF